MRENENIVIWGDSIAKGVIFDSNRGRYAISKEPAFRTVSNALGADIVNRAKMGMTITDGFKTMKQDLEKGIKCDIGVIEFGGNDSDFNWEQISENPDKRYDSKTPVAVFEDKLKSMILLLKEKCIRPVLVTLPPVNASKYFDFITKNLNPANVLKWLGERETIYRFHEQYSVIIAKVAKECGCMLIDLRRAFAGVGDDPDLLCADGVHPNDKGQRLIGKTILENMV